jgi:hypothetical protein
MSGGPSPLRENAMLVPSFDVTSFIGVSFHTCVCTRSAFRRLVPESGRGVDLLQTTVMDGTIRRRLEDPVRRIRVRLRSLAVDHLMTA